jgi:hypothetical protein
VMYRISGTVPVPPSGAYQNLPLYTLYAISITGFRLRLYYRVDCTTVEWGLAVPYSYGTVS